MKHFRIIAVLALSVSLLTGCDFFRSILGKPTSSDIERIRLEQAERQKAVKDSLAAVRAAADSAARAASYVRLNRYYVILGAFYNQSNADRFTRTLKSLNYEVQVFDFRNGFHAVGVEGTDDLRVAYEKAYNLLGNDLLEGDFPWVYDTQTMNL